MSEEKEFYLPPEDFFDEVLNSKRQGEVTDRLSEMFKLLAEKVANHRYWVRYAHLRDDIIAENLYACLRGFDSYSPYTKQYQEELGRNWEGEEVQYHHTTCYNPHAWFTTCCMNNLKQFMGREYKQLNVVNEMKVKNGLDPSYGYEEMKREEEELKRQDAVEEPQTSEEAVKEMFGID